MLHKFSFYEVLFSGVPSEMEEQGIRKSNVAFSFEACEVFDGVIEGLNPQRWQYLVNEGIAKQVVHLQNKGLVEVKHLFFDVSQTEKGVYMLTESSRDIIKSILSSTEIDTQSQQLKGSYTYTLDPSSSTFKQLAKTFIGQTLPIKIGKPVVVGKVS